MELNPDQKKIHDVVIDFVKSHMMIITIGGYAGTGKTYTLGAITETLRKDKPLSIAFVCFTGKAATVLKSKVSSFMGPNDYCGTIHGLIYHLIEKRGHKLIWEHVDHIEHDLIILDEASMVDGIIFEDLKSYGVPILAVGDHGQLPPVSGNFNLMEHPDYKLEKIVRQAEGNPIIRIAQMARESGVIPYGEYGPGVRKVNNMDILKTMDRGFADIILCAMNRTRVNINAFLRSRYGFEGVDPEAGEPVICLKNNRDVGIFNGSIGTLLAVNPRVGAYYNITADMGEFNYSGIVLAAQFGQKYLIDDYVADSFDWAYCITVHKSQGSEFKSVILIEERMSKMTDDQWRRWLYTGVTRAKEKLIIVTH